MYQSQALFYTLSAVLWAIIACVTPEKSYAADLWDIYKLALADDPQYNAAVLDHESARINLPLAQAAFRPSIIATAHAGRKTSDQSATLKTSDDHAISLNLNLPLYDKSKRLGITQSRHQLSISSLRLLDAKQQLMLRVANRYFDLLAAQDTRRVAHLEKIAIKRQMDLAQERLDVGLGTQTDLFDARARFKLAEANEIQTQNQINNDIASLKQIIGVTPEALSILNDSIPLQLPVPNDIDGWIKQAIAHNISLAMETLNLEIALQEINKQRADRIPTVSLDASTASSSNPIASSAINTSALSLIMKLPLYLGGTINLKTQQAGFDYNHKEQLLKQARRRVSSATTSAFLAVTSGFSRVEALLDAVTAGESALQAKEEGFSAGLTTNLDVLDAQRDLSRSRTDALRARYDYILAVLELEMSAGQLDEEDIQHVNGWLSQ